MRRAHKYRWRSPACNNNGNTTNLQAAAVGERCGVILKPPQNGAQAMHSAQCLAPVIMRRVQQQRRRLPPLGFGLWRRLTRDLRRVSAGPLAQFDASHFANIGIASRVEEHFLRAMQASANSVAEIRLDRLPPRRPRRGDERCDQGRAHHARARQNAGPQAGGIPPAGGRGRSSHNLACGPRWT